MDASLLSDEPADYFLANFIEDCECAIAEIIRLQDFLPKDFVHPERSRFNLLICDFSYFNKSRNDEENSKLLDLEEDFYTRFSEVLKRFEILFHTIANLFHGFIEYTELATKELYNSRDATRELEVDALAHLASISYHIHKLYSGATRERLFVSILRISDDRKNLDFLVDYLRCDVYPYHGTNELVFARTKLDRIFVNSCLQFLERTVRTHPDRLPRIGSRLPEVAFGCLLFSADVRANDGLRMKFFIENFFRDNWVFPLSLGLCISVVDEWSKSPAAFTACQNHFVSSRLQQLFKEHNEILQRKEYSASDIVPEKFEALIDWFQRLNTSFRWMVLHTGPFTRFGKQLLAPAEVLTKFHEKHVDMAIRLANFEMDFMDIYGNYIKERKNNTTAILEELCNFLQELLDLFSGNSTKIEKKEKFCEWLGNIKAALKEINTEDPESYDILIKIKRKLMQVTEMLDLRKNLAVSHFIEIILKKLDALAAAVSTSKGGEDRLRSIAQAPYLWPLIDSWVPQIQSRLLISSRTQPVRVLFRKLELSIHGIGSILVSSDKKDLISRAYSCFLEKRLRNVLQSVPNYLFQLLKEKVIPALQKKWDPVIEKSAMRDLADFSENMQLSEVTYSISNMSVGISRFSLKKIGTITVNPKKLLEEGIRKELKRELPRILCIPEKEYKAKNFQLEESLEKSSNSLAAFHRAFIYLCEHLGIEGHQLWWEELEEQMAEADCTANAALKANEIPLVNVIYLSFLKLTDPAINSYFSNEIVWKERKSGKEVLSSRTTDYIERWIPSLATTAIQKAITNEMKIILKDIFNSLKIATAGTSSLSRDDFPAQKEFEQIIREIQQNHSNCGLWIAKIGQLSLLYSLLLQSKMESARVRATILYNAVYTSNRSLLCNLSSLPPSTSKVISLSQRLGLAGRNLCLPTSGHIPSNISYSILAVIITTAAKLGIKNGICEASFQTGIKIVIEHLKCGEIFKEILLSFKDAQLRIRKYKYTVDQAILNRLINYYLL